jgi:hypothetical protein
MSGFEYATLAIPMSVKQTDSSPYGWANHGVVSIKPESLDAELNKFASEGWDLVTVVPATPSVSQERGVCGIPLLIHYFRRRRIEWTKR